MIGPLLMIALSAGLVGCRSFTALGGSEFDVFVEDADRICVESFNRGIEGEEFAEELWKEQGWTNARIEAEIRYAWADALVGQYEGITALGPAPERAGLLRRWARTSLVRAKIYRRMGEAWLAADERRQFGTAANLQLAKVLSDHLAEPIPFRACGRPTDGSSAERLPTGQLLGYAPRTYTAEFPLASAPALKRVVTVHRQGRAVGTVTRRVPGSETMLVVIRMDPRFKDAVKGADLRLHGPREGAPRLTLVRVE